MSRAIRWSDNDRYFGPFTYARDKRYRTFTIMLGSGDGDDYPHCRLRLSGLGHTLIVRLPAVIKPFSRWIDTSRHQWSGPGRGYWDTHEREYGFSVAEGAVHLRYGAQTHSSDSTKSKCWFIPWRSWRHVRRSLYDLAGEHFATIPERGRLNKLGEAAWRNHWAVEQAIEDATPTAAFNFRDFDGELITATTKIVEREWLLGEGKFKWLSLFAKRKIRRSLDIRFSSETGRRKGSWKGGTISHSIDMLPGELHEAAFRRYCAENGMTFVAAAAIAIEARSGETGTGSTEGKSAGRNGIAQGPAA